MDASSELAMIPFSGAIGDTTTTASLTGSPSMKWKKHRPSELNNNFGFIFLFSTSFLQCCNSPQAGWSLSTGTPCSRTERFAQNRFAQMTTTGSDGAIHQSTATEVEPSSALETLVTEGDAASTDKATSASASPSSSNNNPDGGWGKDGSVNDYSRFEKLDDPDTEDPLAESNRSKVRGNDAFKTGNYEEAKQHYTEAISDLPPKRDDRKNPDTLKLRVTLYTNRALCNFKLGDLEASVKDATSAIDSDRKAYKALFRRAQVNEKLGKVEDACRDLYCVARQDPSNKPAMKAYKRVKTQVHSRSLQAIVNAYNEAEAKEAKAAKEKEEKAKRKAAEKAAKTSSSLLSSSSSSSSSKTTIPAKRKPDALTEVDSAETQEEEEATLKEVKKKGYCYFNTKMDAATQALYKDTTPKKISSTEAVTPALSTLPKPLSAQSSKGSGSLSEWNKDGTTWEEQDVSKDVHRKLPKFFAGLAGDPGNPNSATITSVPKCEGTANVLCTRGKLRFFFDLSVNAKYLANLADDTSVTGTLEYPEMSSMDMDDPDEVFEVKVTFDAGTPQDKKLETRRLLKSLQNAFETRMKEFANDYITNFNT